MTDRSYVYQKNTLKHEFLSEISKDILNYKTLNLQANYLESIMIFKNVLL